MKCIAILFLGLISAGASATEAVNQTYSKEAVLAPAKSWSIEATLQTQGIAGDSSPLFGPAAAYKVASRNEIGIRTLLPVTKSVDQGAYSFQGLWRYYALEAKTNLFSEISGAYNVVRNREFGSGGLALGARYDLISDLAFGGIAGAEIAGAEIKTNLVRTGTGTFVYPKVSVFASMFF